MVCAHCGSESHRTGSGNCPNYCTLCKVVGHRQKSADCQFHVCSKCNTIGHSARAWKAPQLQQRTLRGERELEIYDLTFEELDAFSRFPFSDGQLFLAMMTADVKFSPRYAKVFIRTKRLYMLNEDLEIIDLTTDVATGSNASTPFSTPQKKHKLDCDELDAL